MPNISEVESFGIWIHTWPIEPSMNHKTFYSINPSFQLYEYDLQMGLRIVNLVVTLIVKIQNSQYLFMGGIYGPCNLILLVYFL